MMWAGLTVHDGPSEFTVHASNAEMVLRLAESQGRLVFSQDAGDWMHVHFSAPESQKGAAV